MNSAIGEEDKIDANGIYFDLFNLLVEIVTNKPEIRIKSILDQLKEDYNEEEVKNSIRYLISRGYLVITTERKNFNDIKVKLEKRPYIHLVNQNKVQYPRITLTLPPYDFYGLKSHLTNFNIQINSIKDEIKKLFEEANKSIYICSPFLELNGIDEFMPILTSKCKKGVDIKIISRQINKNDYNNRNDEIKSILNNFKDKNCNIKIRNYHYQSQKFIESSNHAKFVISDKKNAYVGSGELRKNSFEKNFELGVILNGDQVRSLSIIFEYLFSVSSDVIFEGI
jgi:phosphatidylserine/phosphatidylglycerophosphate/cardiolipin synthase-like enzyme